MTETTTADTYLANLRRNDISLSEFLAETERTDVADARRSYVLGALLGHVDPVTFAGILRDAEVSVR